MCADWIGTYRLQLHAGFTLDAARQILPYLAELGISHVYLSPCLQAVPGSQHGYDVTDPSRISDDLGGEAAWERFVGGARSPSCEFCSTSCRITCPPRSTIRGGTTCSHTVRSASSPIFSTSELPPRPFRVHMCTLARPYGEALEAGELEIDLADRQPRRQALRQQLATGAGFLGRAARVGPTHVSPNSSGCNLFASPARSSAYSLSAAVHSGPRRSSRDAREKGRLQRRDRTHPRQRALFDAVLQRQFYVLHGWKLSGELTNYRRFFDISSLIGIRAELPQVFAATHARIEAMIAKGEIDGVRVDHPDGLRDPLAYFKRLRGLLPQGRIYIEKIFENDERLEGGLADRRYRRLRLPGQGQSPVDGRSTHRRIDGDLFGLHRPFGELRRAGARKEASRSSNPPFPATSSARAPPRSRSRAPIGARAT